MLFATVPGQLNAYCTLSCPDSRPGGMHGAIQLAALALWQALAYRVVNQGPCRCIRTFSNLYPPPQHNPRDHPVRFCDDHFAIAGPRQRKSLSATSLDANMALSTKGVPISVGNTIAIFINLQNHITKMQIEHDVFEILLPAIGGEHNLDFHSASQKKLRPKCQSTRTHSKSAPSQRW